MTKIFSVDAATLKSGYALIEVKDSKIILLDWGLIRCKGEMHQRLAFLQNEIEALLDKHQPDVVALEDLKFNRGTKNLSAMTKVAFALGAVQVAYANAGYDEITSITANSVRKSWGVSQSKKALRSAVNKKFLDQLQHQNRPYGFKSTDEDITDAIGLAVIAWTQKNKDDRKVRNT